jgi:hypothetical protein
MPETLIRLKAAYDAAVERWDTAVLGSPLWRQAAAECEVIEAEARELTGKTKPFLGLSYGAEEAR